MVAAFYHYKYSCTHSFVHLFNYFFVIKSSTWTCWGQRYAHFSVDIIGSGIPRWCSGKESASQCRRHEICEFDPWVGTILWNRKWQPTPVYCLENSMDRGALRVTVQEVEKSWTWLSGWAHIMGNIMSFHLCQCNGEQKETCFFFKPLRLTVFICLYIFYELAFMVFPHDVWNLFLQEIVIF